MPTQFLSFINAFRKKKDWQYIECLHACKAVPILVPGFQQHLEQKRLQTEFTQYRTKAAKMETLLLKTIQELQTTLIETESKLHDMESKVRQNMGHLYEKHKKVEHPKVKHPMATSVLQELSVQGGLRQRRLEPNPVERPVAFHALLEGNELPHLGVDQTIKYDNITLNLGNGYDPRQGVFTAPKAGLYIFSASLSSAANEHSTFWAELTKEDLSLARLNLYGSPGTADQSSVTAITHLKQGEQVWVRVIEGNDVSAWGDKYSYFTGMLLHLG